MYTKQLATRSAHIFGPHPRHVVLVHPLYQPRRLLLSIAQRTLSSICRKAPIWLKMQLRCLKVKALACRSSAVISASGLNTSTSESRTFTGLVMHFFLPSGVSSVFVVLFVFDISRSARDRRGLETLLVETVVSPFCDVPATVPRLSSERESRGRFSHASIDLRIICMNSVCDCGPQNVLPPGPLLLPLLKIGRFLNWILGLTLLCEKDAASAAGLFRVREWKQEQDVSLPVLCAKAWAFSWETR